MIEQGALTIADDIFSLGTAARPTRSASNDKSSWAYKLGAALGKAIANSFDDIVNGR